MAEAEASTLATGTRVGDRFVLERLLRREVVTEVYLARSEGGGTARFEVRRVLAGAPPGAEQIVRRELDRVTALGSRGIPAVLAVTLDPAGLLVVSEASEALAPRETLREVLARGESLPLRDALRIVREVARVLDALHALSPQVLHRAITPENVTLMERRQRVWLSESGLAHALVAAGVIPSRVSLVGSAYRSPDEILQRPSPRGDVFALASLAFEAMTGTAAFLAATEAATESAMLRGPRPSVSSKLPQHAARIDAALHRAWGVEPDGGFAKASELVAALERAEENAAESAPPLTTRTIIGLGAPSQRGLGARPAPPRASSSSEAASDNTRLASRILPPTQKVQVPQIHPPGTQPLSTEARDAVEKPAVPRAAPPTLSAAEPSRPSRISAPEVPQGAAAVMGRRISRAPGESLPDHAEITKPVRIEPPPEAQGELRVERRVPTSEAPAPRDSWEAVLDERAAPPETDAAELPTRPPPLRAAVPTVVPGEGSEPEGLEEVETVDVVPPTVSRPPPPPAAARLSQSPLPRVSEPPSLPRASLPPPVPTPPERPAVPDEHTLAEEDLASEAPTLAPPPVEALGETLPSDVPPRSVDTPVPSERPLPPLLDDFDALSPAPAPLPPPPVVVAPPPNPEPPLESTISTRPPPPVVAPIAGAAPLRAEPVAPAPPRARTRALVGALAAVVVAAGVALVVMQKDGAPPPPTTTEPAPPTRQADASAARPPADVVIASDAVSTPDVIAADVTQTRDAPLADVAAPPADVVGSLADAGASAPVAAPPVAADAGVAAAAGDLARPVISREPLRGHPRGRDTVALEDAMYDEILACVRQRHRRRVRVTVTYLGETGLATTIRIAPPYDEPETGPCIERVVRRHPVGRFTATDWETGFVWDPSEE